MTVTVWPNRKTMWSASLGDGYKTRSARAVTLYSQTGDRIHNRAAIHMSRGCIGTEVIAHESVHAANWLIECSPGARRYKKREETVAFWTGQIARAIVSQFRKAGLYR